MKFNFLVKILALLLIHACIGACMDKANLERSINDRSPKENGIGVKKKSDTLNVNNEHRIIMKMLKIFKYNRNDFTYGKKKQQDRLVGWTNRNNSQVTCLKKTKLFFNFNIGSFFYKFCACLWLNLNWWTNKIGETNLRIAG